MKKGTDKVSSLGSEITRRDKKKKSKKEKVKSFSLSGPSNFQQGFHATLDAHTGRISGINEAESDNKIPQILRLREEAEQTKEEQRQLRKKEEEQKRRKKEEEKEGQKRRKEEEKEDQKRRRKDEVTKLEITGPLHVEHKLHVDENLNWTDAESLQLLEKLGTGAYGVVYRAMHVPTKTELAIKTVPISKESEASDDITKEINILKLCRHDNVVSLYGCVFSKDSLWIIMDYCGAGSVKDFMTYWSRPFSEDEIAAVLYYVLQGLHYLHSINIIHRDLKSANILLTNGASVKIADFGVSFQVNNTLAKANTVVGTPLFMAPEALDLGVYTEKSDIWSLGITAIEMRDGVPPYNDEHIMRAMLLITQSSPPTVAKSSVISDTFKAFLSRCLRKEADERPTAEELFSDPFFADKDHLTTLKKMLAECKVLKLQTELANKERQRAEILESVMKENKEVEYIGGDKSLFRHRDSSFYKNKKIKNNPVSSPCIEPVTSSPDVQEAIATMKELKTALEDQLQIEQVLVEEIEYYSLMSFRQLVEEIREMKARSWELEKKILRYRGKSAAAPSTPTPPVNHANNQNNQNNGHGTPYIARLETSSASWMML